MNKILFYFIIAVVIGSFFLQPVFAQTSAYNFTRNLYLGLRNNTDVVNLQKFLKNQGFFSGPANGNFGPLTLKAVKKFQSAHGVKPTGLFGPASRALIKSLKQGTAAPSAPSAANVSTPAPSAAAPSQTGVAAPSAIVSPSANPAATTSFAILASSLPRAAQGIDYSVNLSAVNLPGSDVSWQITGGSLPPGISLKQVSCVSTVNCQVSANIFGNPTSSGSYSFTAVVTSGGKSASQQFTIAVAGSLSINTNTLPSGVVGMTYSAGISASGALDSYAWQVSSGSLPPGLSILPGQCTILPCQNPATLSGTTTLAGVYNFSVTVTSGTQSALQQFTVTINTAPSSLKISPATISSLSIGQTVEVQALYTPVSNCSVSSYSCSAPGTTAIPNIIWTSSNPAVVTVSAKYYDPTTEVITAIGAGTATITGTYTVGNLTAAVQVLVTGTIPATLQITPANPAVTVGKTINLQAAYTPSYSCSSSFCSASGSRIVQAIWISSDATVAMVSSKSDPVTFVVDPLTEVATGNLPGITTITAGYLGLVANTSLTVTTQ